MLAQAANDFVGPPIALVGDLAAARAARGRAVPARRGGADAALEARLVRARHRHHRKRGARALDLHLGRHQRRGRSVRDRRVGPPGPLQHVRDDHHLRCCRVGGAAHGRLPPARGRGGARGLRVVPDVCDRRHRDGIGQRPHRAVPRTRDAVDRVVRARRQQPEAGRIAGVRAQVLRARQLLVGVPALRHRARLRRHRHHAPDVEPGRRAVDLLLAREHRVPRQHEDLVARRDRAPARRAPVQDRRGAVPHMDA